MLPWSVPLDQLRVTLAAASIGREEELPGFDEVRDFASESYNLAIGSLAAAARHKADLADRVEIELLDLEITWDHKRLPPEAPDAVLATEPDLVGLSCYCWSVDTLLDLARRIKTAQPEVMIVLGGPSAGPVAEELLAHRPEVSAVARGEGEGTFAELLRALVRGGDLGSVPGLVTRGSGGEIREGPAPQPLDLATLPSPYLSGAIAPRGRSLLLETSRGCRFRCRFCSWMGGRGRLRYRPIRAVADDLAWAGERGFESIKLADTAINFHDERLAVLAGAFRQAAAGPSRPRFTYFLKQELLTERGAGLLSGLPTDEIIIGVESLTPEARRAAGKPPFDRKDVEHKLSLLAGVGPVTLSFILGLPGDTPAGLVRSLEWALDFEARCSGRIHVICLFWLAVLPGSRLHRDRERHEFRLLDGETPYLLESRDRSPGELLRMARAAAELHYRSPSLRLEYFHKEYLFQDAPRAARPTLISRRTRDDRRVVALVGWKDPAPAPGTGPAGDLTVAEIKAFVETDPQVRRTWRVELITPGPRGEGELELELEALDPDLVVAWQPPALSAPLSRDHLIIEGEAELPVMELLRRGGSSQGPLPSGAIEDLDRIPSPYQWGLIQEREETVRMQLGRPALAGVPRHHSPERIFGDLRWALEERHRQVCWLDPTLPPRIEVLEGWVGAIQRADPEGRIRHSYALDLEALRPEALRILSRLPARTVRVPKGWRSGVDAETRRALNDLLSRTGSGLHEVGAGPSTLTPARVEALLRPWRRRGTLDGWRLGRITADVRPETVAIELLDAEDRALRLVVRAEGGSRKLGVDLEEPRPAEVAPAGAARLIRLTQGMLERGARLLGHDPWTR